MKNLLVIAVLTIGTTFLMSFTTTEKALTEDLTIQYDEYSEGWEDGYCEGWKDYKGPYALCPLTPLCPLPDLNCYEGYRCGYNRGFKAGLRAAYRN